MTEFTNQEPAALTSDQRTILHNALMKSGKVITPTQRTWVGLTDEERNEIWKKEIGWGDPSHDDEDLMKAIEQALREKNT